MARKKQKKAEGEGSPVVAEPKHITPVEIQQKEFRVAMRGYHEQDVDQFLDDVTEEVARLHAENRRLREELESAGTRRLDVAGAQEAEAAAQPSRPTPSGRAPSQTGAPDLGPFIVREREFLQSLADLIQSHAEAVKEQLRRAREVAAPKVPDASASSQPPGSSPSTRPWSMAPEPPETGPAETVPVPPPQTEAGPSDSPDGLSFQDRAEPEIAGQDWTQYYSGPVAPAGSFVTSQGDDDILDLTGSSRSEEHDAEDRSLRELFWGED